MRSHWIVKLAVCLFGATVSVAAPRVAFAEAAPAQKEAPAHTEKETNCTDRIDNDGDTVVDCADADCFEDPACKPKGQPESTTSLCSDFIDNDGDGAIDCDDSDCANTKACKGSWKGAGTAAAHTQPDLPMDLPEEGQGVNVEELIGKYGDKPGENSDETCSDGIDNDGDGRTDCADFGCRFDPSVIVCQPNPGFRFSVVARASHTYFVERQVNGVTRKDENDTSFDLLQLRALGPIPGIQNSFFLLSMRAERTPRLTFALFQVPLGKSGHYIQVNSGGGNLTPSIIISASKQLFLDPPFYMASAFEQGNGAAAEVGGPITSNRFLQYRAFFAGGSGRQNGNVGGRFYTDDNTNFTWTAGAQVQLNFAGHYSRFDSPFLYTPVPLTAALLVGGKYDQRAVERYPALHAFGIVRYNRFFLSSELYFKRELEFQSTQVAYNIQAGVLLWPKHLLLTGDFGQYVGGDLANPPQVLSDLGTDAAKQADERQVRAALHWYFYRNIGVLTAMYNNRKVYGSRDNSAGFLESSARVSASFRF